MFAPALVNHESFPIKQDLFADGVLAHHLQVAGPALPAAKDRPCLYPHGGREHVYSSLSVKFFMVEIG